MSRFKTISAVLACALLLVSSAAPVEAATKKKSTTKKSSASAKGKSKSTTAKKPATPTPKTAATAAAAAATAAAVSTLDLPLPAKVALTEKKPDETPVPATKSPEMSDDNPAAKKAHPPNATVEPDSIVEFAAQSPRMQQLIRDAIDLTRLNLTYTFGSADPDSGGMDCSGTIYYLLRAHGMNDIPRDSSGQYLWTRKNGSFYPVLSRSEKSEEFDQLQPGDLMFWTGTYQPARDIPVSHVMVYLGREKETGKRIMFGASDGRSYNGIQRWGVSVFDFKMPRIDPENPEKQTAVFVGYGRIPGLRGAVSPSATEASAASEEKPSATSTPKPKAASSAKSKSSSSRKKK